MNCEFSVRKNKKKENKAESLSVQKSLRFVKFFLFSPKNFFLNFLSFNFILNILINCIITDSRNKIPEVCFYFNSQN